IQSGCSCRDFARFALGLWASGKDEQTSDHHERNKKNQNLPSTAGGLFASFHFLHSASITPKRSDWMQSRPKNFRSRKKKFRASRREALAPASASLSPVRIKIRP